MALRIKDVFDKRTFICSRPQEVKLPLDDIQDVFLQRPTTVHMQLSRGGILIMPAGPALLWCRFNIMSLARKCAYPRSEH